MKTKRGLVLVASAVVICVACIIACLLFVLPHPSEISLEIYGSYTVGVGEEKLIEYKCSEDAKVKIEVGGNGVARIENRKIIGLKEGFTNIKITAEQEDEIVSKVIPLTVIESQATVAINDSEIELNMGEEIHLDYSLSPSTYSKSLVNTLVEDGSICRIEKDEIIGLRGGKTRVFLKLGNKVLSEIWIKVLGDYSLRIAGDCTITEDCLEVASEGSLISIDLVKDEKEIAYLDIQFVSDSVQVIKFMGGQYIIQGSGELEIVIDEYCLSKKYFVKVRE